MKAPAQLAPYALALASLLVVPAGFAAPDEVRQIVDSGSLAREPNAVLLQFLREEGRDAVEPDLRERAIDQMMEALREKTLVDPLEQVGEMMRSPMAGFKEGMKQAFKPSNMLRQAMGAGPGGGSMRQMQNMQRQMESALIDPWVRGLEAASILVLAGDTEAAAEFYRGCLTSIGSMMPGSRHDWLQDRCLDGALEMGPEAAGAVFADIYDNPYPDLGIDMSMFAGQGQGMQPVPQIQAVAAKGLGMLVGTGSLDEAQEQGVLAAIVGMAERKKQDPVALEGAIQGLAFARDPAAVEPLRRLWKKGKPKEIRPVALMGLVAGYRQPDTVRALRKELRSGTGIVRTFRKAKSFAPWTQENPAAQRKQRQKAEERYDAAQALIQAGDEAGYEWAADYLDQRNVPQGEIDHRPDVVRDLVDVGTPEARAVLTTLVAEGHENEWLEALMRIGLFELGDESQLSLLHQLAGEHDWKFGRGTAARWYKRLKPLVWEAIKLAAGVPPDKERLRRMVADYAFAERDRILARKSEREVKTAQFRWQLADALSEFDDPRALPVVETLLEDEDEAVRLSAARALLGQTTQGAPALVARAIELDYGGEAGISRNPEIRSALLRHLVNEFDGALETRRAVLAARRSEAPSLRFFGLTADRLLTSTTTAASVGS